MTTQEFQTQINQEIKLAMIAKDKVRLETLRSINNALVNAAKVANAQDINYINVVTSLAKQRQQSIEAFTKGGNLELANNEQAELDILESYLPKKISDADLVLALNEVIKSMIPAPTIKDMGKVIAQFKIMYPGQDMGKISGMLKIVLPA